MDGLGTGMCCSKHGWLVGWIARSARKRLYRKVYTWAAYRSTKATIAPLFEQCALSQSRPLGIP